MPVSTRLAGYKTERPSGRVHVIAEGPVSFLSLKREAGDALCRPLSEFPQPLTSGPQVGCEASCFACVMRLDRLVAAGVVTPPRPGLTMSRELQVSSDGTAATDNLELRIAVQHDAYIDVGNATYSPHALTQTEVIGSEVLLHTNQHEVHVPQVKYDQRVGRRIHGKSNLLPEIVIDYRDRHWIVDGHHRMMASRAGGSPSFLGYVHRAMFYVPEGELVEESPLTQLGALPLYTADEVAAAVSSLNRGVVSNLTSEFAQPEGDLRFVRRRLALRSLPAVRRNAVGTPRVHELTDLTQADPVMVEPVLLCPLSEGFRIDSGVVQIAAARRAGLSHVEAFVAIPPDGPLSLSSPYLAR